MQYNFLNIRFSLVRGDGVSHPLHKMGGYAAAGCKMKGRKTLQNPSPEGTGGWRQMDPPRQERRRFGYLGWCKQKAKHRGKKEKKAGAFGVKTWAFREKNMDTVPQGMKTWRTTWYGNMVCHMVWKHGVPHGMETGQN